MSGLALEGTLAPELGRLTNLKTLVLRNNNFFGDIPKEIGELVKLELLDLRENKFGGTVLAEIERMRSVKHLLLSDFGSDEYLKSKAENQISGGNLIASNNREYSGQKVVRFARRRLLEASNLRAAPANEASTSAQVTAPPITRSSGSFRAVPHRKKKPPVAPPLPAAGPMAHHHPNGLLTQHPTQFPEKPKSQSSPAGSVWKYILIAGGVTALVIAAAAIFCMCRVKAVATIGPWKTGLSGQLQKAFITGVPKLNRAELETACEDFSNIIVTTSDCTVYKGTLSSGVEIAVASTLISSFKDWTKAAEMNYRKKIDTLSRVNHKNFVNLIGYCEEDEPFARMAVFEYAPNGTLFEHLHVKELEHLDWSSRMRIVMGTSYCLQYMHHDLNPPIAHPNLTSNSIFLTDDYAAKIAETCFLSKGRSKTSNDGDREGSTLPPSADPETNIYSFGVLLLEIISGKLPYSEEQGSLVNWAVEYLNDKRSTGFMIDPSLASFKNNELDIICEVIQDCIQPDPRHRPTMREISSKLREVLAISPEQATPRLSPLWWAELEILSVEAT